MIYDEEFNGKDATKFINEKMNDFETTLLAIKQNKNDDMAIVFGDPINMIDLFRGLAKAVCILEKLTKKDSNTIMKLLEHAIELEKEFDKKHKAERKLVEDAYKNH